MTDAPPRLATAADAEAMIALGRAIWPDDYMADDPLRYLADGEVLVIEDETGLAALGKWEMLPDASGWISGLKVRPDAQRRGLAGRIVDALIERAAAGHAHPARMLVGDDNASSLALADSRGFKEVAHWGLLSLERDALRTSTDAPALAPAKAIYKLEGQFLLRPGQYVRALEGTAKVLIALAQAGRWKEAPDGALVLHQAREHHGHPVEYFQLFEPTTTAAAAIAASIAATRPHRATVVLPWERREGAAAFEAHGFTKSTWAWGARILERPLRESR